MAPRAPTGDRRPQAMAKGIPAVSSGVRRIQGEDMRPTSIGVPHSKTLREGGRARTPTGLGVRRESAALGHPPKQPLVSTLMHARPKSGTVVPHSKTLREGGRAGTPTGLGVRRDSAAFGHPRKQSSVSTLMHAPPQSGTGVPHSKTLRDNRRAEKSAGAWRWLYAGLWLLLVLFAPRFALAAQPTSTNNVLDLDGNESYVELPPKLFTNQVVTVEGWVKWRKFGVYSRFFQFSDAALQIALMNLSSSSTLYLERFRAPAFEDLKGILVPDVLSTNQWVHLAMVAGAGFSKLYFNGVLLSTNEVPVNFRPDPLPPLKNFLGRSVMKGNLLASPDTELNGQMAEVRLWAGERTAEQIKANLFSRLTGGEAGLLAFWNFADGTARDASTNGRDGKLVGNARIVPAPLPSPGW